MLAIFDQTVWALTRQVRAGQFVPEKFEVTFDELEGKESLEYRLSHDVTMRLEGRIDRLDTFEDENKISIKVIDYIRKYKVRSDPCVPRTAAAAGGLYGCGDGNAAGTVSEKRNPSRGNSLLSH